MGMVGVRWGCKGKVKEVVMLEVLDALEPGSVREMCRR